MENINVHNLPRKELMQLCSEHNIRTAGVKQDELVRLLTKKLYPPAPSGPPRLPKARNQISSTESPPMSPKPNTSSELSSTESPSLLPKPKIRSPMSSAESPPLSPKPKTRSQLSTDSQISPKDMRAKLAEKTLSMRSTNQDRSQRSLVDDPMRKDSPEQSRKELSPNSGLLRKPTISKTNSSPVQRSSPSDLLRKKVSTLSGLGKQSQERQSKQSDTSSVTSGTSVRSRNSSLSGVIKQAQERARPKQSDASSVTSGTSVRSRTSSVGAPRQSTRSTSTDVRRPGGRTPGVLKISEVQKARSSADAYSEAASSPRATEAGDGASIIDHASDLCSVYSYCSVSEIATDAGHHYMSEDDDDGRSVSSEPASRFSPRTNKFTPRTSTLGSKLDQGAYPSWESAHGRNFLDSSVKSSALHGKKSELSAQGEEDIFPDFLKDTDSLIDGADTLDSFLESKVLDLDVPTMNSQHVGESEAVSVTAPSTLQKALSDVDRSVPNSGQRTVEQAKNSKSNQEDNITPAVESDAPVAVHCEQNDAAPPLGIHQRESEMLEVYDTSVSEIAPSTIEFKALSDVGYEEFNSGHQAVDQAMGSNSNQEDENTSIIISDAPVIHNEHDDAAIALGVQRQEREMALAAAEVHDTSGFETATSTIENALPDVDGDKFDLRNQTVEEDMASKTHQEGSSTPVVESAAPEAHHIEHNDVVGGALDINQQEIEMVFDGAEAHGILVSSRNTDSSEEGDVTKKENVEAGKLRDCMLDSQEEREACEVGDSQARTGVNLCLTNVGECSTISPLQQEPPDSCVLRGETDPSAKDKHTEDNATASTVERIERHSKVDIEPAILDTSSVAPIYVDLPDSSSTTSAAGFIPPEPQIMSSTIIHFPANEQEDFDTKLRDVPCTSDCAPLQDYNKDGHELQVNLLQDKQDKEIILPLTRRRRLPFSIFLWCSQFISSLFGFRGRRP